MRALILAPLLLPLGTAPDEAPLVLPDGPAAKVWAGVGAETVPARLPGGWGTADWSQAGTWRRWAALVRLEASAKASTDPSDPARRAELCLLARAHGRAEDAWRHYAALGAHPDWVAAVTPGLLPGAPDGAAVETGGSLAPLPDGVLLTPFLPPASGQGSAGQVEWRSAKVQRLRIGAAVIDLTVTVEATGVQVDLTHVEGEAATVRVLLPEPQGFEIRVEYLDWMRREDEELRTAMLVEMKPGEEPHQLYGRVLERRSDMPTGAAERLPAAMLHGGLAFELPADDPELGLITAVADSMGELLGIQTQVRAVGAPRAGWTGVVFRLPAGRDRLERLRFLVSASEAFLLERE